LVNLLYYGIRTFSLTLCHAAAMLTKLSSEKLTWKTKGIAISKSYGVANRDVIAIF